MDVSPEGFLAIVGEPTSWDAAVDAVGVGPMDGLGARQPNRQQSRTTRSLRATWRQVTLLLAAVISPIVEEFFFRGLVQNTLYKFFRRPWPAILSAAALFALVHVPLYQQIPALWVLGVILGWSYYRYRSLAVPVVTHIIFNGVTLVFWYLGGPD